MKYKFIIFDWDGTLMDSADKIVSCMQEAAKLEGLAQPAADEVKNIIGISLIPAIQQLFAVNEMLAKRLADNYKREFIRQEHKATPLFDGVLPLLTKLQQQERPLAVATGKARVGLQRAWSQTDTEHFFRFSRCADEAKSKPDPDMLLQLLAQIGLSVDDAVMIGDTSHDMAMAEAINMDRIAVSYGAHKIPQLEKHRPTEIVHSVTELEGVLF